MKMIAVKALVLVMTAILSASVCLGEVTDCDNCSKKLNRFCCARKKAIWRTNPGKKICCDFTTSRHTTGPRFKQEGQDCGVAFSPPTYYAGTCAPGLECKHFNPEIHAEKKHLHIDKPGICVRPVDPEFNPTCAEAGESCKYTRCCWGLNCVQSGSDRVCLV